MNKTCKTCIKDLPRSEYSPHNKCKDGLQPICKTCRRAACKQYYLDNKSKENARTLKYKRDNPAIVNAYVAARNAKKQTVLTPEEKKLVYDIYKERERITNETGIEHHVDHIKPLSKGGLHHPDNLQILTAHDNIVKSDTYIED